MKKVFNNNGVATAFTTQNQNEGRNTNSSVFFENKTIYSWGKHFAIATILENNTALFTLRDYSVSTAKHKSIVLGALIKANVKVVYCYNPQRSYSENIESLNRHFLAPLLDKLSKARKKEIYINKIESLKAIYFEYAKVMDRQIDNETLELFNINQK